MRMGNSSSGGGTKREQAWREQAWREQAVHQPPDRLGTNVNVNDRARTYCTLGRYKSGKI